MAKLTTEGLLLIEQPTLKARRRARPTALTLQVPYESLRRTLRTSQKHVERDLAAIQTTVADAAKSTAPITPESALATVDNLLGRMRGLKRKLSDVALSNVATAQSMRDRLDYLATATSLASTDAPTYGEFARVRLARQIIDYLLRHDPPLIETARQLAKAEGIESLAHADIELFEELRRIERSLEEGRVAEALSWCRDNGTALKKLKSTLEFNLRFQDYIEHVRAGRHAEAIAYGRKHLVPWGETHMAEIRQGMALLAFTADTTCLPYARLYEKSRWAALKTSFRSTLFVLHSLPPLPMLNLVLHAGLASLKLPVCLTDVAGAHNVDCPVCDPAGLGALAAQPEVPFAHHVNSVLVCSITGKLMEGEGREPLALPNGRVYSREALEAMALENGGEVVCPRTGDRYDFLDTRKVFIS